MAVQLPFARPQEGIFGVGVGVGVEWGYLFLALTPPVWVRF